jgi:hypothetical protein
MSLKDTRNSAQFRASNQPLRWHGTEATDHVTVNVQQQFSTDLNSTLFACQPKSWAGSDE